MRIGIYNPYFDSLGGGERYTLSLASHWSGKHDVVLFWEDDSFINKAQQRFNIDLSRVKTVHNFFRSKNVFKKLILSKQYDLIFILTDGSIPMSLARFNILHFQVPFREISAPSWKLNQYQVVVCNSNFTKNNLDPRLGGASIVIYPPVDTSQFKSGKKENIILSVGRFTSYFQTKKQEVLIEAWKSAHVKDWQLVLAGGLLPSDKIYFEKLEKLVSGLSIRLLPNISFPDLVELYSKASIYWHAAGFEERDPKLAEHFGITTVEAMASGCIPIVYNAGGLPEIVEEGVSGFLWKTKDELIEKTHNIIKNTSLSSSIRKQALQKSKEFDVNVFYKAFDKVLEKLPYQK